MTITNEEIKAVYPRHGSRWTDEDNLILSTMFTQNKSVTKIADRLERTEIAILSRLLNKGMVYITEREPRVGVEFYYANSLNEVYAVYPNIHSVYNKRVKLIKRRTIVVKLIAKVTNLFHKPWGNKHDSKSS